MSGPRQRRTVRTLVEFGLPERLGAVDRNLGVLHEAVHRHHDLDVARLGIDDREHDLAPLSGLHAGDGLAQFGGFAVFRSGELELERVAVAVLRTEVGGTALALGELRHGRTQRDGRFRVVAEQLGQVGRDRDGNFDVREFAYYLVGDRQRVVGGMAPQYREVISGAIGRCLPLDVGNRGGLLRVDLEAVGAHGQRQQVLFRSVVELRLHVAVGGVEHTLVRGVVDTDEVVGRGLRDGAGLCGGRLGRGLVDLGVEEHLRAEPVQIDVADAFGRSAAGLSVVGRFVLATRCEHCQGAGCENLVQKFHIVCFLLFGVVVQFDIYGGDQSLVIVERDVERGATGVGRIEGEDVARAG